MRLLSRKSERREERQPPQATPASETFASTATTPDGAPARVVATTVLRNELAGSRHVLGEEEPPPEADLSISETGPHPANQKSRPVTWLVVAFIAGAFLLAGLGLVFAQPWVFIAGLCAIVAGVFAGWAAGIMADRGETSEQREKQAPDAS